MGRGGRKRPNSDRDVDVDVVDADVAHDGHAQPTRKKSKRNQFREGVAAGEDEASELPRKKFYRQRAHANPFSDHKLIYPLSPAHMDWREHYPGHAITDADDNMTAATPLRQNVEVLDIGCGFGGLLFALAPRMPTTLILGLEIRLSVAEYVSHKVRALRAHQTALAAGKPIPPQPQELDVDYPKTELPGGFMNIAAVRANAMKFLPNFFGKGTISKIFLCFPDPHFKARKHKQRIVSGTLTAEYAYVLKPGGLVYTITDVEDLAAWMAKFFDASPSFERVAEEEIVAMQDGCVDAMRRETEESKKVDRHSGPKYLAFWRRKPDAPWPGVTQS